ncbi:hypothetical protein TD95_003397 [Thielaviopsis punctulata]|uniref:F-box domain-containing protein n=1 Tax=Thielaviopsis punctulata TaxID=72032 RepID=A0A0F4ZFU6_9PEZI|nr:hypothetical protein TD95_003397 [Thielaviopsis punctulata]
MTVFSATPGAASASPAATTSTDTAVTRNISGPASGSNSAIANAEIATGIHYTASSSSNQPSYKYGGRRFTHTAATSSFHCSYDDPRRNHDDNETINIIEALATPSAPCVNPNPVLAPRVRTGRSTSRPRPLTMASHQQSSHSSHPPVSMSNPFSSGQRGRSRSGSNGRSRSGSFTLLLSKRLRAKSFSLDILSHHKDAADAPSHAVAVTDDADVSPDQTVMPHSATVFIPSSAAVASGQPIAPYETFAAAKSRRQSFALPSGSSSTSIRAAFRRASVSFRGFMGLNSFLEAPSPSDPSAEPTTLPVRPSTSANNNKPWHRLRQAASFRHHSQARVPAEHIANDQPLPSPTLPIPGMHGEPPIIPRKTGAAAKAAVAMQNHYLTSGVDPMSPSLVARRPSNWRLKFASSSTSSNSVAVSDNDRESGIGIQVAGDYDFDDSSSMDATLRAPAKVDFVSSLPTELAIMILSLLDFENLDMAKFVSRSWYNAVKNSHVWRESFFRSMAKTFATDGPVLPGTGRGIPRVIPGTDWERVAKAKAQLDLNWESGIPDNMVFLKGHLDSIYCLQTDEDKIITGSRDRTIRIWDLHTYECRTVIGPPAVLSGPNILYDSEGNIVHHVVGVKEDDDTETCHSLPRLISYPMHHDASILCLQYDDRILVTGSSDSTCIVYDAKKNFNPIARLKYHSAAVLDLAFDDKHIVTCSKDSTICVWDRATHTMLRQLTGHRGPVNAVQMRGDSIISCSGDFRVILWNLQTGAAVREFDGHTKGLACLQFSEDGRYVASAGNDKEIRIWDAHTGKCLHKLTGHTQLVRSLHIDSVSGRLISGSYDTNMHVFDLATGQLLFSFDCVHSSWVMGTRSDYRRLISSGQDPKILVIDFGANVPGIELLESR